VTITPQTRNWLRQSAALDGAVVSQTLLNLLERVEALEQRPIPSTVELATPTPEAAPVDFRTLCAELLQPLAEYDGANPYHEHRALITRARAALAEPVVVAAGGNAARWLEQEADR
jgi:hypothetical protein